MARESAGTLTLVALAVALCWHQLALADDEDSFADRAIEAARARAAERVILQQQREQLQLRFEARAWAVQDFVNVTDPEIAEEERLSAIGDRAALMQGIMVERYTLQPTDELLGQIHTGRTLNNLFAVLRGVVGEHERHLAYLSTRPFEELTSTEQEHFQVLDQFDREFELDPSVLADLQCQYIGSGGTVNLALSVSGESRLEPMPLDWPLFIDNDPSFDPLVDAVESAREQYLQQLQAGMTERETRRELMTAVDSLLQAFSVKYREALDEQLHAARDDFRNGTFDPLFWSNTSHDTQHLVTAMSFTKTLRNTSSRLLEMKYLDVSPLDSNRPDGRYTLIQLLAYMQQQGLKFTAATPSSQRAQQIIHESLVQYYRRVQLIQLALEHDEEQIEERNEELLLAIERLYELEQRLMCEEREPREIPFGLLEGSP